MSSDQYALDRKQVAQIAKRGMSGLKEAEGSANKLIALANRCPNDALANDIIFALEHGESNGEDRTKIMEWIFESAISSVGSDKYKIYKEPIFTPSGYIDKHYGKYAVGDESLFSQINPEKAASYE